MREATFGGLPAAKEQRVGRSGAWRDKVARGVAWRSERGLWSRYKGCGRQAGSDGSKPLHDAARICNKDFGEVLLRAHAAMDAKSDK